MGQSQIGFRTHCPALQPVSYSVRWLLEEVQSILLHADVCMNVHGVPVVRKRHSRTTERLLRRSDLIRMHVQQAHATQPSARRPSWRHAFQYCTHRSRVKDVFARRKLASDWDLDNNGGHPRVQKKIRSQPQLPPCWHLTSEQCVALSGKLAGDLAQGCGAAEVAERPYAPLRCRQRLCRQRGAAGAIVPSVACEALLGCWGTF